MSPGEVGDSEMATSSKVPRKLHKRKKSGDPRATVSDFVGVAVAQIQRTFSRTPNKKHTLLTLSIALPDEA